jgi:hypothetical protein
LDILQSKHDKLNYETPVTMTTSEFESAQLHYGNEAATQGVVFVHHHTNEKEKGMQIETRLAKLEAGFDVAKRRGYKMGITELEERIERLRELLVDEDEEQLDEDEHGTDGGEGDEDLAMPGTESDGKSIVEDYLLLAVYQRVRELFGMRLQQDLHWLEDRFCLGVRSSSGSWR